MTLHDSTRLLGQLGDTARCLAALGATNAFAENMSRGHEAMKALGTSPALESFNKRAAEMDAMVAALRGPNLAALRSTLLDD